MKPRRKEDDIHWLLAEWGRWRECPQYWDREVRKVDIHVPPGPSIPKGVPNWKTPEAKKYDFWMISEWYDRLNHRSVIRTAMCLMYLQWPEELSQRQIAAIMDVHHDTVMKYIAQGQERVKRFLDGQEKRRHAA